MKKRSTGQTLERAAARRPEHAPVRRLGLACDWGRFHWQQGLTCSVAQRNLAWLVELSGVEAAARDAGILVDWPLPPRDAIACAGALDDMALAAHYEASPSLAWAAWYDDDTGRRFPALSARLAACDLVVGFEMSRGQRRWLHQQEVRYLNLRIHPLRFLRDLAFKAETNCRGIADLLEPLAIGQTAVQVRARWLKALFGHHDHPAYALPGGVPLVAAQTGQDSVLIRQARFAGWTEVRESLAALLAPHRLVAVLPHPHDPGAEALVALLQRQLGKHVVVTDANSYGVLCSARQTPVFVSLSSSLGIEAAALGVPSQFLLGSPEQQFALPEFEADSPWPIGHGLLDPDFWQAVFRDDRPGTAVAADPWALGDHLVRDALEAWGFGALRNGLQVAPACKRLLPAAALPCQERDQVLRALAACDPDASLCGQALVAIAAQRGIDLMQSTAPLGLGEQRQLDLGPNAAWQYLRDGFHHPEPWGVWSSGHAARLAVPLDRSGPDSARPCQVTLALTLQVYEGVRRQSPVVTVRVDGETVAYVVFRPHGPGRQRVQCSACCEGDDAVIELEVSHAASPRDIEGSLDARTLGVGLLAVTIERLAPEEPLPRPTITAWGIHEQSPTTLNTP